MIQQMRASGRSVSAEDIRYLEELYGLNRPFVLRYGKWFFNLIQGDMGQSLIHGTRPVTAACIFGSVTW